MEEADTALGCHDYAKVAAALDVAIDSARNPRAIQWCIEQGLAKGHVLALYRVARNLLKYQCGRVPTPKEVSSGVTAAVILVIRCAQDVVACRDDMAKSGLESVFTVVRDKVRQWVAALPVTDFLVLEAIHHEVAQWFGDEAVAGTLPSPVWVTGFGVPMLGWTFTWGNPAMTDVTAFSRCQGIRDTRAAVSTKWLTHLRDTPTLDAFFAIDL
jgi:hypothetical protein